MKYEIKVTSEMLEGESERERETEKKASDLQRP